MAQHKPKSSAPAAKPAKRSQPNTKQAARGDKAPRLNALDTGEQPAAPIDAKGWSSDQVKFQFWLALPSKLRKPTTQRAFADELGVHESTLSDWKKLDGWHDAVSGLALDLLKDAIPEVLASLRDQAKKGSFQHIKMVLEMVGLYTEKKDIKLSGTVKTKAYAGWSPDEWDDEPASEE